MYDITSDSAMLVEFEDDAWICPDIDTIFIQKDPWYYEYGDGQTMVMVVNQCDNSAKNDINENISSYADGECATSDVIENNIINIVAE